MSVEFTSLDELEVIELEYQPVCKQLNLSSYFKHLVLTVGQFSTAIENSVRIDDTLRTKIFDEGLECEVLKFGSEQWQKGKIRVKMTVEFCQEELEEIEEEAEESENGESEDSDFDSLDDLRRELNQ